MITNEGIGFLLEAAVTRQGLRLHLFANDAEVSHSITSEDVTECKGYGYAPIALKPSGWVRKGTSASYPDQTFLFTGKVGRVYGSYITNAEGAIIQAHKFEVPFQGSNNGDKLHVGVRIDLRNKLFASEAA